MSKRAHINFRHVRSKREFAWRRPELRLATEARVAPDSPVSMPIKVENQDDRRLIDEFIARRDNPRNSPVSKKPVPISRESL